MLKNVNFILNGDKVCIKTHPLKRLVDVLRDDFDLTGTKEGCGEGECGACSVLVDNQLANSCLIPAAMVEGKSVTTIEGLTKTVRFKVLKNSFEKAGSVQCGYCTPGMIMAAEALLHNNPHPTEDDIRVGLSGNLCRCTGYNMIVEAVLTAVREGEGLW